MVPSARAMKPSRLAAMNTDVCGRAMPTEISRRPCAWFPHVLWAHLATFLAAMETLRFLEEYAKHTALNLGQALQGLRYLTSHPDVDVRAPRGSLLHALLSLNVR